MNGLPFGASAGEIIHTLGQPDEALENYTGELEMLFDGCFYRCYQNRLVEATFPDLYQFVVDGVEVLSMLDWLGGLPDHVDKARFRISLMYGIAYDYRNPAAGSVTVFEAGRWDMLL